MWDWCLVWTKFVDTILYNGSYVGKWFGKWKWKWKMKTDLWCGVLIRKFVWPENINNSSLRINSKTKQKILVGIFERNQNLLVWAASLTFWAEAVFSSIGCLPRKPSPIGWRNRISVPIGWRRIISRIVVVNRARANCVLLGGEF